MKAFLKTWMLAIAIITGALLYFLWMAMPFGPSHLDAAMGIIKTIQPLLIFSMLFVSFCKVEPSQLKPRRWHAPLLTLQVAIALLCTAWLYFAPNLIAPSIVQAALLCFICPTATAAIVVTGKLGGDIEGLTAYTTLINLAVAITIPTIVPLVAPHPALDFLSSFFLIIGKIFPMLILPFFAALLVRFLFKRTHRWVVRQKELAFYLWAVSLTFAITVSTHSLMTTTASLPTLATIALVSLAACVLQFYWGRRIGQHYHHPIASGQAMGQKNTVFLIWASYTFFDPVSSIAGGFYSIWHNLWNSYQLSKLQKKHIKSSSPPSSS